MAPETAEFTSGDIAAAEKPLADASPAQQPQTAETADASTKAAPAKSEPTAQPSIAQIPLPDHERIIGGFYDRLNKVAWANDLKRDEVEEALALRRQLRERQKSGAEAPQPDLRAEDGTPLYSAGQAAALARYEAKQMADALRQEFGERVGPMENFHASTQRRDGYVQSIQNAMTWPGFAEHIDLVTAAVAAVKAQGQEPDLRDLYIRHVVPKLAASRETLEPEIRKAVLADLNNSTARTQDDLNPSRIPAGSRKPDKDKSFKELVPEVSAELRTRRTG